MLSPFGSTEVLVAVSFTAKAVVPRFLRSPYVLDCEVGVSVIALVLTVSALVPVGYVML